jgi:hypothetical protein
MRPIIGMLLVLLPIAPPVVATKTRRLRWQALPFRAHLSLGRRRAVVMFLTFPFYSEGAFRSLRVPPQ